MPNTAIEHKFSVRKCKEGFVGAFKIVINKKVVWSKSSQIVRLNKEDALADAQWICDTYPSPTCFMTE